MNKQVEILCWKVRALFTPKSWFTTNRYDKELDAWLINALFSEKPIEVRSRYTAEIDGVEIWIANAPFSCGSPLGARFTFRPSRAAMCWLSSKTKSVVDQIERQDLRRAMGGYNQ